MAEFIISANAQAYLNTENIERYGFEIVPDRFFLGDRESECNPYSSVSNGRILSEIRMRSYPTPAPVSVPEYQEQFERMITHGNDLLHIECSSGLSHNFEHAKEAARRLAKIYPDRTIAVIDSKCMWGGYALLLRLAAQKKQSGANLRETAEYAEKIRPRIAHLFVLPDTAALKASGWISKFTPFKHKNIIPVLTLDKDGKIAPYKKINRKGSGLSFLAEKAAQSDRTNYLYSVFEKSEKTPFLSALAEKDVRPEEIEQHPTSCLYVGANAECLYYVKEESAKSL